MATRDPHLAAYRKAIIDGMSAVLWRHAWIDFADAHRGGHLGEPVDRPGPGESWDDYIPARPPHVRKAADELAELYEFSEGDIVELYGTAIEADTGRPYEFDTIGGVARAEATPQQFGMALAEMALGTGTSWFDDHKKFELDRPSFECWYDSDELHWSGRTMVQGRDKKQLNRHGAGKGPRQRTNPSRAELRDPKFVQDTIQEGLEAELQQKVAVLELKPGPTGKVKTREQFTKDIAANLATALLLDDEGELENPAGAFSPKGERMYRDIKAGYVAKGNRRAAEIAARTVYSHAKKDPGLLRRSAQKGR